MVVPKLLLSSRPVFLGDRAGRHGVRPVPASAGVRAAVADRLLGFNDRCAHVDA